jgi:hypothetical protein
LKFGKSILLKDLQLKDFSRNYLVATASTLCKIVIVIRDKRLQQAMPLD